MDQPSACSVLDHSGPPKAATIALTSASLLTDVTTLQRFVPPLSYTNLDVVFDPPAMSDARSQLTTDVASLVW